jgi:nucleoside phosphorylase
MQTLGNHGTAEIGILTIIDAEFEAVRRLFGTHVNIPGTQYFVNALAAPVDGVSHYDVVACQSPGQTNLTASGVVVDLIEDFRPEYILLIGIAGGHGEREVGLGDVVVADFVEDTEYFKLSQGKSAHRKRPYDHPSYRLQQLHVGPLCKSDKWHSLIDVKRPGKKKPRATVANLASGEKLLGDPTNAYQKLVMKHFEKAAVFEMEGFGVASAVYKQRGSVYYNPQYLIIRGISDLVNKSSNQQTRDKWRAYAATAAAAFGKGLVDGILAAKLAAK